MLIIKQGMPKSCTHPIAKITIASNPIEPVIRYSDEALGSNIGNIPVPPIIAPAKRSK